MAEGVLEGYEEGVRDSSRVAHNDQFITDKILKLLDKGDL
jgi:hypothetical protein